MSKIPLLKPVSRMLNNDFEFPTHAQIQMIIFYLKPGIKCWYT